MGKWILSLLWLTFMPLLTAFANEGTIKIGIAGPLTGPAASFGDQMIQGAKEAAKDINAQGGINGQKIEIIPIDDACDPKQAITAANRLVNENNVKIVIGHFCSSSTIPASEVYADAETLMITPASTSPIVTDRGYPTIFRICGRDDEQGLVAAEFIHNVLKAKRVAIIHDKDTYGKGLADATEQALKSLGTNVVLYEGLTRGEKDFNALVTKISDLKADCVYFGGLHPEAGPLLRQLREQKVPATFVTGDGVISGDFVTSAGGPEVTNGIYMTFSADPRQSVGAQKVVDSLRKQGFEPEGYTLYTYAAIQAAAEALKNVREYDGKKMADWLHHHKVVTILGDREWNEKGDLKNANYLIYQWNDLGKYEPYKQN